MLIVRGSCIESPFESVEGGAEPPGVYRIADLPDIDRLEGYDANMECDPPADYYDAYALNEQNLYRLNKFIAGYLADTGRRALYIQEVGCVGTPKPACLLLLPRGPAKGARS